MRKNRKIGRSGLVKMIIHKTKLSEGKRTLGYFTKEQLQELSSWLLRNENDWEKVIAETHNLRKKVSKITNGNRPYKS